MKTGWVAGLFAGAAAVTGIALMPSQEAVSMPEVQLPALDPDILIAPSCVAILNGEVERNPSKNEIVLEDWIAAVNAVGYYNGKINMAYAARREIPTFTGAPTKAECISIAQTARPSI